MLGLRFIHGDDRVLENALLRHRAETDHTGRRLLGATPHVREELAALCVEERHDIGAVVHRDVRFDLEHRVDVPVVGVAVLALPREDRDAFAGDERGGGIVLCRERIRRAQRDLGPAIAQREREVGGLRGDVQACGDADAGVRPLFREALADLAEHGHLARGPFRPPHSRVSEVEIGDVVLRSLRRDRHYFLSFNEPKSRSQPGRRTAGPSMNCPCV